MLAPPPTPTQPIPTQFTPYSPQQGTDIGRIIRMAQQMGIAGPQAEQAARLFVKTQPPDPQKAAIQSALFGPQAARRKVL